MASEKTSLSLPFNLQVTQLKLNKDLLLNTSIPERSMNWDIEGGHTGRSREGRAGGRIGMETAGMACSHIGCRESSSREVRLQPSCYSLEPEGAGAVSKERRLPSPSHCSRAG